MWDWIKLLRNSSGTSGSKDMSVITFTLKRKARVTFVFNKIIFVRLSNLYPELFK